jgi:excisionase family DNA binding protein
MIAEAVADALAGRAGGARQQPGAETFLSTREAARVLGINRKTLEALRARGEGPPHLRIGRSVRYRREDLDRAQRDALPSAAPANDAPGRISTLRGSNDVRVGAVRGSRLKNPR